MLFTPWYAPLVNILKSLFIILVLQSLLRPAESRAGILITIIGGTMTYSVINDDRTTDRADRLLPGYIMIGIGIAAMAGSAVWMTDDLGRDFMILGEESIFSKMLSDRYPEIQDQNVYAALAHELYQRFSEATGTSRYLTIPSDTLKKILEPVDLSTSKIEAQLFLDLTQ